MSLWVAGIIGAIIVLAGSAEALENPGVIRGQINFAGTPPQPEALKIGGDQVCEDINSKTPIMRDDVIVNPNKTLKNVVVWISSGGPDTFKPQSKISMPAVLTQQGCSFYPRVLAVQVGQPLELRNVDPTVHNINALPKNNDRFNKAMIGDKATATVTFEKPEIAVKLKCDIHPWMVAWVAVFDHPLFTISGDDGTFEISGLPAGEYVVETWHEEFGGTKTEVLVQENDPTEVIFTYTDTGKAMGLQVPDTATTSTVTTGPL